MAFLEDVRLPLDVEQNVRGGPGFRTTRIPLRSGFTKRNRTRANSLGSWNISYGISDMTLLDGVLDVFYITGGAADEFRFRNWQNYQVGDTITPDDSTRQSIGQTDGSNALFQMFLQRIINAHTHNQVITKPVVGTTRVWVNDVEVFEGAGASEFTIDTTIGQITLGSTLAAQSGTTVAIMCEFDTPVVFADDNLDILLQHADVFVKGVGSLPAIRLQEVPVALP